LGKYNNFLNAQAVPGHDFLLVCCLFVIMKAEAREFLLYEDIVEV
jgi:hypothetical protein